MKRAEYLIGCDIGTSSTKTLLCRTDGVIVAEASAAYPLHSPRPGWNEQDPADWWKATCKTVRAVLKKAGVKPEQVRGIGLSGQMHGSVFLDDKGEVIRPALLWNDQRTEKQCRDITRLAGGEAKLISLVNNVALTGFTAPKILWLRDNEPANYRRLKTLLLPKDYVRYLMTGELAMDISDASGTLLLDVKKRRWSTALVTKLGLDPSILPPLLESTEVAGRLTKKAARELGLAEGTRVVAGAGDQPAGAVGMGVVRKGIVSATIGTSGVVFAHADRPVPNAQGLLQSFCHAVPDQWCVFGCMLSAGGSLDWFRNSVWPDATFDGLLEAAERASPTEGDPIYLPYLDGERCPHPDPHARACWIDLHRGHDRGTLARAVIEGITLGMADQLVLMKSLGVSIEQVRCGGGGAKSRYWRQLQADSFHVPTSKVDTDSASAFGAALLAGVGTEVWGSVEEACRKTVHASDTLRPRKAWKLHYGKRHALFRGLYPALKDHFRAASAPN